MLELREKLHRNSMTRIEENVIIDGGKFAFVLFFVLIPLVYETFIRMFKSDKVVPNVIIKVRALYVMTLTFLLSSKIIKSRALKQCMMRLVGNRRSYSNVFLNTY